MPISAEPERRVPETRSATGTRRIAQNPHDSAGVGGLVGSTCPGCKTRFRDTFGAELPRDYWGEVSKRVICPGCPAIFKLAYTRVRTRTHTHESELQKRRDNRDIWASARVKPQVRTQNRVSRKRRFWGFATGTRPSLHTCLKAAKSPESRGSWGVVPVSRLRGAVSGTRLAWTTEGGVGRWGLGCEQGRWWSLDLHLCNYAVDLCCGTKRILLQWNTNTVRSIGRSTLRSCWLTSDRVAL